MNDDVTEQDPTEAESLQGDVVDAPDADGVDPRVAESEKIAAEAQAKVASLNDQLLRTAAEFDNFKKRARREMDETRVYAAEKLLLQLIPVLDNFERALAATQILPEGSQAFVSGVKMVADQFRASLEQQGVKRYVSLGQPFDPSRHEAVSEKESEDAKPGTVLEEYQAGYTLGDRVIRPAMVVVAKKSETPAKEMLS
jgi:molecular chaperone GrpE